MRQERQARSYAGTHKVLTGPAASRRTRAKIALAVVLALVGALVGPARADARPTGRPAVAVAFDNGGITLSRDEVRAGLVTFTLRAPGVDVGAATMFRLRGSATLSDLRLDWQHELSDDRVLAAQGTRDLSRHALFVGLAEVARGRQVSVTELLNPGVYYLQDSPDALAGTRHMRRLLVQGPAPTDVTLPRPEQPTIAFTADNRFTVRGRLPAVGSVRLNNRSGSLQEMNVWPVRAGTTDVAVQTWLDAGAQGDPGFFLDGPTTNFMAMSPGRTAQLSWDLPAGTYLVFDEVRDPRTGLNRAFEGMHQVVELH
jgi:hypothetical protein